MLAKFIILASSVFCLKHLIALYKDWDYNAIIPLLFKRGFIFFAMGKDNPLKHESKEHVRLGQWFATAICGNDILSSTFYVSGIAAVYVGAFAPIVLAVIGIVLFFYKSVYTEVVEALPTNGGAYNCLLNATSKNFAAIAGTTTVLSYIATAVISGQSAIQYLGTIISLPVIPLTIGLLLVFALLVIMGIKDSAKVAFAIFSFHVVTLTVFVLVGGWYSLHHHSYFMENLRSTQPLIVKLGGVVQALFFGFSASLLGVSGFESSANFVEEQKRGVFRKTLRNMLICVAIFNPIISFLTLNVLPYDSVLKAQDFLLSDSAKLIGTSIFQYWVVIDAFAVLAGAVLTGFVGVSGLIYRMTTDGCFPEVLAKVNKKGSYPYIIILFFILCTSILLITKGNLLSLAGVYTIAFLGVMSMFALGNLIMRVTRHDLKRTYHAPLLFVILAFIATASGIVGNIILNPVNLNYFVTYFIPAIIFVFITLNLDLFLQLLEKATVKIKSIHDFIHHNFEDLTHGKFVVFVHHIDRIYQVLEYINRNEIGREVYFIHCNNGNKKAYDSSFKELKHVIPALQEAGAFKDFNIHYLYKDKPFGPDLINQVSKELKIRPNRILIGSIHHEHPFDYDQLSGARIIF